MRNKYIFLFYRLWWHGRLAEGKKGFGLFASQGFSHLRKWHHTHQLISSHFQNSPNNMAGMNNPPGTPRDDGEMGGSFLNPFQSESVSRVWPTPKVLSLSSPASHTAPPSRHSMAPPTGYLPFKHDQKVWKLRPRVSAGGSFCKKGPAVSWTDAKRQLDVCPGGP